MVGLSEALIYELRFADIVKKQKSVVKLFPSEYEREKAVGKNGGAKLTSINRDLLTFQLASGDDQRHAAGVTYITHVQFLGVEQVLERAAMDRKNWTKDQRHLNLNALGRAVLYGSDLKLSCNCPASQYWGFNYIKTQSDTEYNYPEDRSPDIRNKNQYGVVCKHFGLTLSVLPFYAVTVGTMLKNFYGKFILDLEKTATHNQFNPEQEETPQATPKPVANKPEVKKPVVKKLAPKEEEQAEDEFKNGEPGDEEENPEKKVGL